MENEAADPALNEIYATFAGAIDQNAVQRFFAGFAGAVGNKIDRFHVLFQSFGGSVSDGICLYNFFRALPVDLTLYNAGGVSSAAAIAFLGAQKRKVSAYATFMIHRTQSPAQAASAERLKSVAHSVLMDDERIEAILRSNLNLTKDQWNVHSAADLWLSAEEAIACGLAEIGEFTPPKGVQIFNI